MVRSAVAIGLPVLSLALLAYLSAFDACYWNSLFVVVAMLAVWLIRADNPKQASLGILVGSSVLLAANLAFLCVPGSLTGRWVRTLRERAISGSPLSVWRALAGFCLGVAVLCAAASGWVLAKTPAVQKKKAG